MQNVIEKKYIYPKMLTLTIFYIFTFLCLPISVYCNDAVYKEEFNIILKQLDDITERIEKIEDKEGFREKETIPEDDLEELKDDVDYFLSILEEVEKKSIVDRIELKADFRTRFDWYDFKGHDNYPFTDIPNGPLKHEKVSGLPSNRLRLNLKADIGSWLRFHSRLSMYHNWADDDYPSYPELNFINQSRLPTDIALKVERVYADIFFEPFEKLPMAFTFGRLPATDGFPTNLRENTARKSTYPNMAYDIETDGVGFSVDLSQYTGLKQSAFRLVYLRRNEDIERVKYGKKMTDKQGIYRIDEYNGTSIDIYISQFETLLPGIFIDTLFLFNFVYIPSTSPLDMRFSNELYQFYYDSTGLLFIENTEAIGSGWKATCYVESKNFLDLNIDAFVGAAYMKSNAKGATTFFLNPAVIGLPGPPIEARLAYETYKPLMDSIPSLEPLLKKLQATPPPVGLLNADGTTDQDAYAVHIGFRYQIPFKIAYKPKFGAEFNYGSKYWMGFSDASEDPLHKLSTRGSVWDFYLLQQVSKNFTFRFGYTDIQQDYGHGLGFYYGLPHKIDHHIKNFYFLMDARF